MNALVLRYEPDPDPAEGVGRLWFDLRTDRLSGSAFFWSDLSELPKIISKLESYPLGDAATWAWGYNRAVGADAVLSFQIEQAGLRGELKASVGIRDFQDPEQRLHVTFQTDYASLEALRLQLVQVREHLAGYAILSGI